MALDTFGAMAAGRKRWEGSTPASRSDAMRKVVAARWANRSGHPTTPATLADDAASLLARLPATRQFVWWKQRLPELVAMLQPPAE